MSHRDPAFAYLAHDLSQLLWAVQGRARTLASRLDGEDDAALARSIAEDAGAAAAMLADAGESAADPVSVAAAAWRQVRDREVVRDGRPTGVACEGPAVAPPVAVPAHVLRRILGNLLANAVDAMPDGGRIVWTAEVADTRVRLTVTDDGPGLPEAVRAGLFTDGATVGKADGHGLGLAGSRVLARQHGGDLTCCEHHGGARFVLELPEAAVPPAVDPDVAGRAVAPLRLLVVDDEASVRDMLADLLASEGHQVTLAVDCDTALAQWREGAYDAALIDLGLPGRTGADLARELRTREPRLRLILFTGWGREDELAALEPGLADDTATKPVDLVRLRALLTPAADHTEE